MNFGQREGNGGRGAVTWGRRKPSAGRSPAADVSDEVLGGQDGGADAADEEDQHPDGVQVGRDQPKRAEDQPEQDDQGNRSYFSAAHLPDEPLGERCGYSRVYPVRGGGTHSVTACSGDAGL